MKIIYSVFFCAMLTNMCPMIFMFISDKYMTRVFIRNEKYIYGF